MFLIINWKEEIFDNHCVDALDYSLFVSGSKNVEIYHDMLHKNFSYYATAKCLLSCENNIATLNYLPFPNPEKVVPGIVILNFNRNKEVPEVLWQDNELSAPKVQNIEITLKKKVKTSLKTAESALLIGRKFGKNQYFQTHYDKKPKRKILITEYYERNPDIVRMALERANGRCENPSCKNPTSFIKKDGEIYLEVHHKKPLSEGGEDTLDNTIALCANCHRQQHCG